MTVMRAWTIVCLGLITLCSASSVDAGWPLGRGTSNNWMAYHASQLPWHDNYAYMDYRTPVAHVVPPNANMQMNYSWGVPSSRMIPIYNQFNRQYPGGIGGDLSSVSTTPYYPSDTDQFGVYNVRGPWTYVQHDTTPHPWVGLHDWGRVFHPGRYGGGYAGIGYGVSEYCADCQ